MILHLHALAIVLDVLLELTGPAGPEIGDSMKQILFMLAAFSVTANADTVYLSAKPGSVITADAAASSTKPVYACQTVHRGPNINPVKVPGTETIWSSAPGKGETNVAALLADGKTAFRCKSEKLDQASGRMKSASN